MYRSRNVSCSFTKTYWTTDISITLNTYTSVFNRFKESELEKVMEYYKTNSLGLEPIKNEEIVENKEVEIEDDMEM